MKTALGYKKPSNVTKHYPPEYKPKKIPKIICRADSSHEYEPAKDELYHELEKGEETTKKDDNYEELSPHDASTYQSLEIGITHM